MRAKVEGALARLMMRELSAAWNAWTEHTLSAQKYRQAMLKWVYGSLSAAMAGDAAFARQARRKYL